jgi:hypothetical protein
LEPPSEAFSFSAEVPPAAPPLEDPALSPLEDPAPVSPLPASPLEDSGEEPSLEVPLGVVDVVEVEVVRAAAFSADVSVGGVMSGVLLGIASEVLAPPHPPMPTPSKSTTDAARVARGIEGTQLCLARDVGGPIRLPHVGQSLRSFCASWPQWGQTRRFSTAHGSRERDGASGSTLPTTSSCSPESRSK